MHAVFARMAFHAHLKRLTGETMSVKRFESTFKQVNLHSKKKMGFVWFQIITI